MKKYLEKVKEIKGLFEKKTFTKVPREENTVGDALARVGSTAKEEVIASNQLLQEPAVPSIGRADQIACVEKEQGDPKWGRNILCFLRTGATH